MEKIKGWRFAIMVFFGVWITVPNFVGRATYGQGFFAGIIVAVGVLLWDNNP